jgi:hypothetical protein
MGKGAVGRIQAFYPVSVAMGGAALYRTQLEMTPRDGAQVRSVARRQAILRPEQQGIDPQLMDTVPAAIVGPVVQQAVATVLSIPIVSRRFL